ncbi:MAG: CsiV family protein [Methylococcales bacterium]|nr:hypothetical protein [Methylococcaceae bacterium]
MTINTNSLRIGMLALLVLMSSSLRAQERAYQIELIVFTQDLPNTELFEQTISKIDWPTSISEVSDQRRAPHTTLDESLVLLGKDPHYRIVKYFAWSQTLPESGDATAVRLRSIDGQLNGFLQLLQQEQSLKVLVDIEYPADQTGSNVLYRLNEKRPVKSGETYYLDHPRLGAIVKVELYQSQSQ